MTEFFGRDELAAPFNAERAGAEALNWGLTFRAALNATLPRLKLGGFHVNQRTAGKLGVTVDGRYTGIVKKLRALALPACGSQAR
jgi:hypothetical protein